MWDFQGYCLDELLRINDAITTLSSYGIDQDEEMLLELSDAIEIKQEIFA